MTDDKIAKKKNRKRIGSIKQNPKLFWVYLGLALIILYVLIYIIPSITGALKTTYTVTYGEVDVGDETTVYIVRDEKLYLAETDGNIKYYCKEGEMVKKGARISSLDPVATSNNQGKKDSDPFARTVSNKNNAALLKNTDGICKNSGVFSLYVDGYESLLSPKKMTKLKERDVAVISEDNVLKIDANKIKKGNPMFKVVSNAKWYVLCWLDNKEADKYEANMDYKIIFDDEEIGAFLYKKVKKEKNKTLVIFQTNRYYEKYSQFRTCQATIVSYTSCGLLIRNDSIREEKGVKGVYVKNRLGDFVFKPINILAVKDDTTVVSKSYYYDEKGQYISTVNTYDQVLK